jgi:hypothetical protein
MDNDISTQFVENAKPMIKDLLYGDESVTQRDDYLELTGEEIRRALQLIVNNPNLGDQQKYFFLENTWRIHYKVKPPTVDEFLTPKWIGAIADSIYPHIVRVFKQFMNPYSNKRVLVLSTAIGFGKSSLSALIVLFVIVHLQYMRNPKEFFNLNEMGSLVIALLSFTMKKVDQVLLQPFSNTLRASPMFERVRQEHRLEAKQKEIGNDKIAYTSAGRMGSFQFSKDIHITTVSDRSALLGLNIIFGIASEISFWLQKGVSVDEIWGTFNDLWNRVDSRFAMRYLSGVILDSSPLDLSLSPIDKWVYSGEAEKDPSVMIVKSTHWDVFPEKYPNWNKTGKTFPVFRGSASKPPKVLTNEKEIQEYGKEEVLNVPIDIKQKFLNDTKKMVADYAGFPAGGMAKLISDFSYIEGMFTDRLVNTYSFITAPADKPPEGLIWNQIKDDFFINVSGRWEFYRSPSAKRTIHIDLAETGDMAGIAMNHFEMGDNGQLYIINDFTIGISPEKSTINIDAVAKFILDLRKAGIQLYKVTSDQYQSSDLLQRLKRDNIPVDKLSVDRETAPYKVIASWIMNGRVKVGYNIFLKNNFKSLIEITTDKGKQKVDHSKGEVVYDDGGDWKQSFMGVNAKDVSDAFTGSAYVLITDLSQEIPQYQWAHNGQIEQKFGIDKSIVDNINKRFGLTVKT